MEVVMFRQHHSGNSRMVRSFTVQTHAPEIDFPSSEALCQILGFEKRRLALEYLPPWRWNDYHRYTTQIDRLLRILARWTLTIALQLPALAFVTRENKASSLYAEFYRLLSLFSGGLHESLLN